MSIIEFILVFLATAFGTVFGMFIVDLLKKIRAWPSRF